MQADRNPKLDHAKLFFMFCVVLGHVADIYDTISPTLSGVLFYVYLFHIPGFVFISGLFAKSSVKGNRWDRAVSYLMLFVFMTVIRYALAILRKASAQWDFVFVTDIRWYALGMFFWYAAAILLKKANPRWVMAGSVLLSMIAGYISSRYANAFALVRAINFFPFFYAGILIDPECVTGFLGRKQVRIASVFIVLAAAALVFWKVQGLSPWRNLFRGLVSYRRIETVLPVWSGAFWRLAAFLVSSVMMLAWIALMPEKRIPVVSDLGTKTLSVFAFHGPVYKTVLYFIPILDTWIRSAPIVLSVVFSACILILCSLPPFDRSVRKFMSLVIRKEAKQ